MALDRQKILNELGSVVNQLQSADCGCMGKMFSNSGSTLGAPLSTCGGCRRGCCHGHGYNHGYDAPCAGEPYSPIDQSRNRPCMGSCNPQKLYADTYNYLNNNLMKPTMNELYNDLKNINASNTISNNPIAKQMGLPPGNTSMQGLGNVKGMNQSTMPGSDMVNYSNAGQDMSAYGKPTNSMYQPTTRNNMNQAMSDMNPITQMGGMGANILKMMSDSNKTAPGGQLSGSMGNTAAQSSPNPDMQNGGIGAYYNLGNTIGHVQNPTSQYMTQSNTYAKSPIAQGNPMTSHLGGNANPGAQTLDQMNVNSPAQQTAAANIRSAYGQHTPGVMKFNEMFPGLMQGDLGFDPMAIAVQMNPNNQQKAAFSAMEKLMNSNAKSAMMHPAMSPSNAANANIAQANNPQQQVVGDQMAYQEMKNQLGIRTPQTVNQLESSQQVYTAVNESPVINRQIGPKQYHTQPSQEQCQGQQQQQQYQVQQQHNMFCPNTEANIPSLNRPSAYAETGGSSVQIKQQAPQHQEEAIPPPQSVTSAMTKEPIYPADTSDNQNIGSHKHYEYNTLGQPVEMLPAKMFYTNEPPLPQTLSPQSVPTKYKVDPMKYSNVKNTVSKTSIMGYKPIGNAPSRNQLQHIYNQYKGSHSYTKQNVTSPPQAVTHSDRKLNVNSGNVSTPVKVPIEKVVGDTPNNVELNYQIPNKADDSRQMRRMGDVPTASIPHGDSVLNKEPSPNQRKSRNGLQDMKHTPYQGSAAWSFHGRNNLPISVGSQFRNRAGR